ncbi:glycosyltransferase family 4 protein [Silvibacterium dinghuense]|uniref:Colanic acid biosynthesis glycosyltransferase WcaL n=1 Tax=Silvibacterium dinghuense TaxID=1560006 RepID=A0A4Q1SGW9_9BACT|nr:glycosyltransferase family 4 protein [Silvibacterium dinghuense]RXS96764.1 colanic acid biosynthesis glycosyltransferase WcaL [Silvibacterium dinghuense]GGG93428.1 colanic acid biosynthesis glycosyltransferase WcaL [Silvibacterium dinghuense]
MSTHPGKIRMAYLLSQYPAVSHTFFLKEILGLRQLGFEIETASINAPDRPLSQLPPLEAEEAARTYYVKQFRVQELFFVLFTVTLLHPAIAIRGIRGAMRLGGWDFYQKAYALLYLVEAFLLGSWMRKRGLHHLHVHFGGPVSTVAMLTAEAWGFDYSMTIHGPEEFYDVSSFYLPRKIERAKFVFCISDFCRSQLMKYSEPAHWDKMHVVRLGVDTEEFKPVTHEPNLPLQIICVGRLVPAKGQHILLRAFDVLRAKGHAVHLTLIGDGPDRRSLEHEAAERQLSAHVTFCGALNHNETRERISQTDIFAMASFAEGIPVALMEAMAMSIPCVSTGVAGIPELIQDRANGLLVSPSSVESLAEALESLVVDPDLRANLGAAGRARVIEHYNLTQNAKKLASTFENCLS